MNRRFQRWKFNVLSDNFNMRLHALAIELGFKKFKATLFMAWKSYTQVLKTNRYSRLLRAFKNIKVFMMQRKQLKAQALGVLG